jgi:hypothetical protein
MIIGFPGAVVLIQGTRKYNFPIPSLLFTNWSEYVDFVFSGRWRAGFIHLAFFVSIFTLLQHFGHRT